MKPCIMTPTTLDITQYTASPLGNVVVKKPNISVIIVDICFIILACLSPPAGVVAVVMRCI